MTQVTHRATPGGRASQVVWLTAAALAAFVGWALWFELDEVSSGAGKIIPTSREQVIQSLEGGILSSLAVREGDVVSAGQLLAQLDPTRLESTVQESSARMLAALATAARLRAEVSDSPLVFPPEVAQDKGLVRAESALYASRRDSLARSLLGIEESLALVRKELTLTDSLKAMGAAVTSRCCACSARPASCRPRRRTCARSTWCARARNWPRPMPRSRPSSPSCAAAWTR